MLSESKDRYYIASGLEYTAYGKWQKAIEDHKAAEQVLAEAKYDLNNDPKNDHVGMIKIEKDAKYEVERAVDAVEWEQAQIRYNEIKQVYDALIAKRDTARDAWNSLNESIPQMKQDYENAMQQRKDVAKFILDNVNIEVPPYSVTQGPPEYPEDEEANNGND